MRIKKPACTLPAHPPTDSPLGEARPFPILEPALVRLRQHSTRAFSLVECALALAIIGIAFVPIMGLLPAGLSTSREAINYSVGSNIAQLLFNEAQQTDFNILTANSNAEGQVRYFDYQGTEVKTAGDASIVYHAKTYVVATTSYPGTDKSNASVATVTVQVASNASNQTLVTDSATKLWARTNRQPILTFSFYVSRNQ